MPRAFAGLVEGRRAFRPFSLPPPAHKLKHLPGRSLSLLLVLCGIVI